jgi:hypothetical protein
MKGKNNAISKFEQSEIEGQREIENVYYELETQNASRRD